MHSGFFISMEGIDGIGKSTQLDLLLTALTGHGTIYFTKEPGDSKFGSNVGAGIREIIFKKPGTQNLAPGVADLLFLADHVQNVSDVRKALGRGQIVVSDRYADSQFAYAAHPSKRAPVWACRYFTEQFGVVPDLTILLFARGPKTFQPGVPAGEQGGTGRYYSEPVEDISWALTRANARRGAEAGKQDGKAWNDISAQMAIQDAYFGALKTQNRTRLIEVWETDTPETIHGRIMTEVLLALTTHNSGRQYTLPIADVAVAAA
jgi:dTMP kinase